MDNKSYYHNQLIIQVDRMVNDEPVIPKSNISTNDDSVVVTHQKHNEPYFEIDITAMNEADQLTAIENIMTRFPKTHYWVRVVTARVMLIDLTNDMMAKGGFWK